MTRCSARSDTRRGAIALCLTACVVACGCKSIGASTSDYGAYRAVRVEPTVAGRLRAASLYLDRYPSGAFREEVSDWFGRIEPLFYEASADSAQGMQTYLDALPRGPHAAAAEQRRDALLAESRSAAAERLARTGAAFEQRLARAAQGREDVIAAYSAWVARLLEFKGWGRPLESAGDPFSSLWSGDPKPACDASLCRKTKMLPYEVEVDGKPQAFVCTLEVALRSERGVVVEALVRGPDLFARLLEAHRAAPVNAADERAKAAALAWMIELTSGAAARKLGQPRCAAAAKPPAAMVRQCDGVRLELIPSAAVGADDRVVIRAAGKL